MTPDLTARIEELARETATGINQWHDTESMKTHCIELDTVVLRDVLSTFAASIIAERDAEAAALRQVLEEHCGQLHYGSDDAYFCLFCDGTDKGDVCHKPECVLHESSTTGRETLAELERLRNMEQVLQQHFDTFTGEEQPPDRHNIAYSAIRVLVARAAELASLRERVRELEGALIEQRRLGDQYLKNVLTPVKPDDFI